MTVFNYRNATQRAALVLANQGPGVVMISDDHAVDGSGFWGVLTFGVETRNIRANTTLEDALIANRAILATRDLTLIEVNALIKLQIAAR